LGLIPGVGSSSGQHVPQLNIVQRISGLIKSQLPMLQALSNKGPSMNISHVELLSSGCIHTHSHSESQ
jgi:hypothetical protein